MSWGTLLKIGTAIGSKGGSLLKGTGSLAAKLAGKSPSIAKGAEEVVKTVAKPAVYAVKNPKTAILAPGVAYAGWKAVVDDKPVVDSAKDYGKAVLDVALGEDRTERLSNDVDSVKETATDFKDTVTEGKGLLHSLNESLGGIKSFISNITGGEGLNMFGNFFGNIAKGKVSGMSFIGMIAAGLLTFGRFGWLGKIAGAMLGMTMIGNNSHITPSLSQSEGEIAQQTQDQSNNRGRHRSI